MTETLGAATGRATDRAKDRVKGNPFTDVVHGEAVDHLKAEAREYLAAQAQRLLVGAGRKLGETTGKLNDIADGNSPGFAKLALDGGRKLAEGKGRCAPPWRWARAAPRTTWSAPSRASAAARVNARAARAASPR